MKPETRNPPRALLHAVMGSALSLLLSPIAGGAATDSQPQADLVTLGDISGWDASNVTLMTTPLGVPALGQAGPAGSSAAATGGLRDATSPPALQGDALFAWQTEFFGPGLDGGSSVGAGGARATAVWDDGSGPALYVGGGFVTAGPHHVDRIARWDGNEWAPLTGPNGTGIEMVGSGLASVKAMTVFEGDLIVAGFFNRAGGEVVHNIARWDGSTWSPLGEGLTGSIGVEALMVFDGALIAGGTFTQSGEETVDRIARWDGSQWTAVGGGVSGAEFNQTPRVYALAEYQGELVAGGNFLQAGGVAVQRIARWNGSDWASLGAGVSEASNPAADLPSVRTLTLFEGDLIAGGNFTKAGGLDARLIARWDGSGWSPLGGGMDGEGNPNVSVLEVFDGELIAGGNFTEAGGVTANRVARWDGATWSELGGPAANGTSSTVASLAVFDGELIAAGQGFTLAGGIVVNAIARWDGVTWSTLSGQPGTGPIGDINAMTLYDGALIVAGNFTFAGGETVFNIARWDGTAWSALDGPLAPGVTGIPGGGVSPSVQTLTVYQGDLIAGGAFFDAGGLFVRHIARWDGNDWSPLGPPGSGIENTAGSPAVNALAVFGDELILAGRFTTAGGVAVSNIARWDGTTWSALGSGLNDSVDALIVSDGSLIAGGLFTAAGGTSVSRIARWDGAQWSALGSGVNGWVLVLTLHDGALIAGGDFSQAGGQAASRVASWDGTQWLPLGVGANGRVLSLGVYEGGLYAGGMFSQAGGSTANRVARWSGGVWSPLVGPAGEGVGGWSNPNVSALAVFDADGGGPEPEKLHAGGRFNLAGGITAWNLAVYAPADPQSNLSVAPGSVAFGGVTVGDTAAPRLVTLSSLGNVAVEVSAIAAAAPPFSQAGGNCPSPPFALAPADSCTLSYGFAPTEVGDFEQAITIDTGSGPAVLTLAGQGLPQAPPAIQIDPDSFSVVLSTGSTLDESLTIQNAGDETLEWSLSPDCDLPGEVAWLDLAPASGSVAGGGAQTVTVSFDAGGLAAGEYQALPCFASNDPDRPLVELPVTLTVTGTPPMLSVDPESLSAIVDEGAVDTQPLSLTNLGQQSLEWAVTDSGDTGEIPEFGASVSALTVWDDGSGPALYVGGANSSALHRIGRWDDEKWTPLDMGFDNGSVLALTVYQGELIAGGTFTAAAGVTVAKVARWDGGSWQPLGSGIAGGATIRVSALTVFDGELIAGGSFTEAGGITVNGIARWNGSEWSPLGAGLTTQVFALTVFDGALIAGGGFTQVGDQTFNRIARWDGSVWSPLDSGFDGSVLALTAFDSALIAGGSFSNAGGAPASRLARWDGAAWLPLGAGVNTQVGALTVLGDDLFAGGLFSEAGDMPAANVARWDGAEWSPLGAGTGGRVSAVAAFGTELIAGGTFTTAGDMPANRIARWDGSAWSPVLTVIPDCAPPSWLGVDPISGTVAGGDTQQVTITFDATELTAGDYEANLCLASNDLLQPLTVVPATLTVADGGTPELAFDPTSLDFGDVAVGTTSAPQSTTLHNNGNGDADELSFNDISGSGFDIDAGDCGASLPAGASCEVVITFTPPFEGPINPTLVASTPGVPPGLLQLSGNGVTASPPSIDVDPESLSASLMQGATETQSLTIANLGDEDLEWLVPDLSQFGANVNALTVWDDGNGPALYVGGNDNTEFKSIARWDGAEWSLLGAGMDDNVEALTVYDGALIAGGRFTEVDGVPVNRVARWDGSQWSALGDGFDSTVSALTVFEGDLIASGLFTEAEGQPANRIARWDGTSWSPLGTGMDNRVTELTVYDGALHAAGWFTEAGGVPASRVASWDGTQWSALGAGVDSLVHAMTVYDGELIVGGRFEEAGGIPANRVASWDGSTWAALGTGVPGGVTVQVDMLTVFDGALIAGGRFLEAGGVDASNIARWDGSAWSALGPGLSGHVAAGTVFDGALIAGGQFNFAGELPTRGIARWDGAAWSALVTEPSDCDVPAWMQVDPTEGTIAGGEAQPVSVTFDAGDLPLGDHQANLCLLTNDPDALLVMVPVELTVLAAPEADIAPGSFAFTLFQGDGADDVLDVGNIGAADLEWSIGAVESDLVFFDDIDYTVPATQFGGSVRWDTGETCDGCQNQPFDFNMWRTNSDGNLAFFWPGQSEAGGGGVTLDGSRYAVLGPGDTVGPHSEFILFTPTTTTLDWRRATDVDGRLGFRFVNPDTQEVNYGYARITTTGINGHPATVKSWVYDQGGNPIAVNGCTDPAEIPWLTVDPLTGTTPPDGSLPVDVSVDTTGLEPGVHQEQFCVVTNDPAAPLVAIPVEVTVLGDQPVVDVSPPALELAAPQGGSDEAVLSIGNLGTANLDWSLEEAVAGSGVTGDVVADGSFEAGTPSPSWEEGSTNFGTPLCDAACGNFIGARSGDWWAWFGGSENAAETGFVSQEVTLPAAPGAELRFWLQIPDAFTPGRFEVRLDEDVLFSVTEADADDYSSYTEVVVDVSTFADGTAHLLTFEGETEAGGITNFFLDDVSLVVASNCISPTDIPWLSATPTAGATPPDGSVPVNVVANATGLEPGTHAAQLCLTSNDPQTSLVEIPITLNVTEGGGAELSLDPQSLDFGDVPMGTTSAPQFLTLSNTGNAVASGLTAMVDPADSGFTADLGACGDTLPAGESCSVAVTFTPAEVGSAAATLEIGSAEGATANADLSGNGVGGEGFTPVDLEVDPAGLTPEANGLFEPGETVDVAPAWRNDGELAASLGGTASSFTGPEGAAYSIDLDAADYGLIEPGDTASCLDTEVCYRLGLDDPAARPAGHWDATFDETLDDTDGTTRTWSLHIGASFDDVPSSNPFYPAIETLLHSGVTGGCTAGGAAYCPGGANSRAQMPVFVLRALMGSDYTPPPCVEGDDPFGDVPFDSTFCPWIQDLADRGIVSGCGDGNYCPGNPVTRAQMAIFLLKTLEGADYDPPECSNQFTDVPCPSLFADWIEDLATREITSGCSETEYCPGNPVSRAQMAVFVTRTFGLTLYGP